jgi:hypothetical protein
VLASRPRFPVLIEPAYQQGFNLARPEPAAAGNRADGSRPKDIGLQTLTVHQGESFGQLELLSLMCRQRQYGGRPIHCDLLNTPADDEDSHIVAVRIGWGHEEAHPLRIVGFCRSRQLFAIQKSDYDFAAVFRRCVREIFFVVRIPPEILHEENGLQIA